MVKIAMIGFGGMAGYHLVQMKKSGLFDVVGVYDIDPKAQDLAKKKGLAVYKSYEELAAVPGLNACLIATPNDVHAFYALKLAQDKINILCEKPVTLSAAGLQQMLDAAKENHVVFMVHQNRRWDRDYLIIKNIYENGCLGKMYKIDSNVTGSHGLPGSWRKVKAKGGGMLWDWGVHLIDQILQLNPATVTGVTCRGSYVYGCDCDDGIDMTLDFEDGFCANINIDTNKFIPTPRWCGYGLDGTAVIKTWSCRGKIVKVKSFVDSKNKGIQAGNGFTKTMADRSKSTIISKRLPKVKIEPYAFYKNFCNCVQQGAEQVISNESVMRCMLVMEAGFQSMEEKRTIITSI